MSGILDVALSGLQAAQAGMVVSSTNVANSTNENYSRRELILSTAEGGGVVVSSINNFADRSLQIRQLDATSDYSHGVMWTDIANNTEDYMTLLSTGFTEATNSFYSSFDDLASSPGNYESKVAMLSALETMETSYGNVDDHFEDTKSSINSLLGVDVATINNLAEGLASNNEELRAATSDSQKLTLMVERDTMLKELSTITDVQTVELSNGEMDVYIGDGISLVSRSYPQEISVDFNSESNSFQFEMNGNDISDKMTGGSIGGQISAFDEFVQPSVNQTGYHAFALAASINDVFSQWVDEDGDPIADSPVSSFSTTSTSSEANAIDADGNGTTVQFQTTLNTDDFSAEELADLPEDIVIKKSADGYDIFDKQTGELIGSPTTLSTPVTINGMTISMLPNDVELQEGETVEIMPFINANSSFETTYDSASSMNWGTTEQTVELAGLISQMGEESFLNQGSESLKSANPFFDNDLITLSSRVKNTLELDTASLEQLNQDVYSLQGVSLDEEAANQIRYQELYEVSTQLVQTSQSMFDTLLNAIN